MQTFVSKARRPEFELHLRIIDLNNVPLVSGTSFIKWHLPQSTAAEHRGRTPKASIKDHKVLYDYSKVLPVRLVVGKDQTLQATTIQFEVLQEYSSGGRGERITLGVLSLNLAEYVEGSQPSGEDGEHNGITRRYLMQQSKINSTLKLEICMKHVRGDKNYIVPPLRTAPVFGGIAGIMSYEADAADDAGHTSNLPGRTREAGESQDMYRRILAASWAAAPGQLKADECIEDIFAGGDGWGAGSRKAKADAKKDSWKRSTSNNNRDNEHDSGARSASNSGANLSSFFNRQLPTSPKSPKTRAGRIASGSSSPKLGVSGRQSLEQSAQKLDYSSKTTDGNDSQSNKHEVDEFDDNYREDLRCWQIRHSSIST